MTKPFRHAKARIKKPKSLRKGPDRRRQIIAAASELFARNGFEGTSIRDIAAASGVLSGSLYYHFPSKEDLLFTVHQESLTAMRQEVETAIAGIQRTLEAARRGHRCALQMPWRQRDTRDPDAATLLQSPGCPKTGPSARRVRKDLRQPDRRFAVARRLRPPRVPAVDPRRHELDRVLVHAGGRLSVDDVGRQIALMVRGAANSSAAKK